MACFTESGSWHLSRIQHSFFNVAQDIKESVLADRLFIEEYRCQFIFLNHRRRLTCVETDIEYAWCMYVSVRVCMYVSVRVCMYVSVRVCMYVSVRVCMYVCSQS